MQLPQHPLIEAIDKHHEDHQEKPRGHFGLSHAGHPCERWLWLSFRWAVIEKHPGRILRLFRRGQNEEAQVVSDLTAADLRIRFTGAQQKRVVASALVSGSMDGLIESGVPEAPKKAHILEVKTMNDKAFKDIQKNGLERSKPVYWIQCQVYMHLSFPVDRALFIAVNKNTDELYIERVKLDKKTAEYYLERAKRISTAERIPDPISTEPAWYQCKFCAAWNQCHGAGLTKEVNCRTCAHSTPDPKRGWICTRWNNEEIPEDAQRTGCRSHVLHPDLVPWEMGEAADEWTAVYKIEGKEVKNGENGYSSREILTMVEKGIEFNVDGVDAVRGVFGGEVVGK